MNYESYFGLNERPFKIGPDPRFLYLAPQHKEVLAKCQYMIANRVGPVYVYGPIGTGKTSVAKRIADQLAEDPRFNVAFLIGVNLKSANAFLRTIMEEFEAKTWRSYEQSLRNYSEFLVQQYQAGKVPVLIIDEAQNLNTPMLELIHYLLNFETNTEKLLQIVLFGQHQLAAKIAGKPELKSRMFPSALAALTMQDMEQMIAWRYQVAGGKRHPFTTDAINAIFRNSLGLPREVCKLCDLALLAAAARELTEVDADLIAEVAAELEVDPGQLAESAYPKGVPDTVAAALETAESPAEEAV